MPGTPVSDGLYSCRESPASVLQKDGEDVWAISGGAAIQALTSLGQNIKDLELDGDDPALDDLGYSARRRRSSCAAPCPKIPDVRAAAESRWAELTGRFELRGPAEPGGDVRVLLQRVLSRGDPAGARRRSLNALTSATRG